MEEKALVGMTREEAQQRVKDRGFGCQIVGDGDTITDQTPAGGAIIPGNATVILYAGAEKATELCTVPNLLGRTASEANSLASNAGLILRFTGATNSTSGSTLEGVQVAILDENDKIVQSAQAQVGGTSFSLKTLDDQIHFGELPTGCYTYMGDTSLND